MMTNVDVEWVVGTGIVLLGVVITTTIALFKHIDTRFDKIEKEQDLIDQKFEDHRTDVYKDFTQKDELHSLRADLGKLFSRIDRMNATLHELVGLFDRGKK